MGITILISNKIYFKLKLFKRDGERHFILITGTINQDEVSILNIYAPKRRSSTYVKEFILKLTSHIKPHTLITGDFNATLSPMDKFPDRNLAEILGK